MPYHQFTFQMRILDCLQNSTLRVTTEVQNDRSTEELCSRYAMPRGHVVTEFNRALKCQVQERNLTYDNVNQTQKKKNYQASLTMTE